MHSEGSLQVLLSPDLGLSETEAVKEAARCLYCYQAPCIKGCPAEVNVPEFIARLRGGNPQAAARIILQSNVLAESCARVCPMEELCQKQCSQAGQGQPIAIGKLQRFALEQGRPKGQPQAAPKQASPEPGQVSVAVIGAGPSGLAAAAELAKAGVKVKVYDKADYPGGTAGWGIPVYRLPKEVIDRDVTAIRNQGVEIQYNTFVDAGFAKELLTKYDYVYLATGLGKASRLQLPGVELAESAEKFLTQVNTGKGQSLLPQKGQEVAVIGGGNTALDVACMAKRLGAERVVVIYRRSKQEMPGWHQEYMQAVEMGIEFRWLTAPLGITGEYQGFKELHCGRIKLGEPDESGRRRPIAIQGSEFTLRVHYVYWALGQEPNKQVAQAFGVSTDAQGRVWVNSSGQTTNPRVHAGGDLINGGASVVQAVQEGKLAAQAIIRQLNLKQSEGRS